MDHQTRIKQQSRKWNQHLLQSGRHKTTTEN